MNKKRSTKTGTMCTTTTSADWGFGPVSGKGGKTTNVKVLKEKS